MLLEGDPAALKIGNPHRRFLALELLYLRLRKLMNRFENTNILENTTECCGRLSCLATGAFRFIPAQSRGSLLRDVNSPRLLPDAALILILFPAF